MVMTFARIMGLVLIALGAIALSPGFVSPEGLLFNTFRVDLLHNVINLMAGVLLAAVGFSDNLEATRRVTLMVAGLYGIFSVVGFVAADGIVLSMPMNMADNVLNLTVTVLSMIAALPQRYEKTV